MTILFQNFWVLLKMKLPKHAGSIFCVNSIFRLNFIILDFKNK